MHCGGLRERSQAPQERGSFFGYIDEAQYLNGVVAAHVSKSKKLGFIAAKPIPQWCYRNINAFTLGARSVDPKITTTVVFTGDWSMPVGKPRPPTAWLTRAWTFTMHVDGPKVIVETAAKRGKFVCGYHVQACWPWQAYLTGAEWNWITAYKQIIDAAQAGKPHPNPARRPGKDGFGRAALRQRRA